MKERKHLVSILSLFAIFVIAPCVYANTETPQEKAEGVTSLADWFKQGKANGVVKTLWYNRNFDNSRTDRSTAVVGGNLNYETASLHGFSLGTGFKTGQGAGWGWNDGSDDVYSGLLAKSSPNTPENYTALDEYFVRYNGYDTTVTIGAQAIETPWLKGFDVYTTPVKYRGISIKNTSLNKEESKNKFELQALYLDKALGWTNEDFESMASGWTNNLEADGGMFGAGVTYRAPGDLRFEFWNYYFEDVLNDLYVEARYRKAISENVKTVLTLKYLDRQDVGNAYAGPLDTWTAGGDFGISAYGATVTAYYGQVGNDAIAEPYGSRKIAVQQAGANLQRADETVYGLKLAYNFGRLGLKDLTTYVFYGRYDTPDSGVNASADYDQIDFDLRYKLGGWFKGCDLRLRYAIRNADHFRDDVVEDMDSNVRAYLVYRF